ncbi:chorismate mutase [Actinomadura darangshiensis]|uniref:Chorismate mutase n=1 Tax=Actinomadura darangshiensis TaxID=705336 RepID=A0A4R5AFQ0_9ACTN|nr:chorismate mutase [Actinomadura darangshiensis]TDD69734.1 chorismate mutase [Actinomadura darangshiensis]
MHDQVIEPGEPGAGCPACAPSGELRVALPDAEAITTLGEARAAIDGIDAVLAELLEHRAAVAAVVQRLKPVGGFAGRDPGREREIVEAMAARAPSLGAGRLAPIVNAIIEAGLDAAASRR